MSDDTFEINGWTIYAHPLFLDQLEVMIEAVEKARKKDPKGYKKKRAAKLLGLKQVPIIEVTGLSEAKRRALAVLAQNLHRAERGW